MHEHQRGDSSKYVKYDCMKLIDFPDAIARARAENPDILVSELCTDPRIAAKYSFSGVSYMQGGKYTDRYGWTLNTETAYDRHSIMQYESYMMSNEKCQKGDVNECPLKRYKDPNNHDKGVEMIPKWDKPSVYDWIWVKNTYSWADCAVCGLGADDVEDGLDANTGLTRKMVELLDQARQEYVENQLNN